MKTTTPTGEQITEHMHLVHRIVADFVRRLPRSVQREDLVSAGTLGLFYAKQNDYGRALDFWNRSLSIEPHQPQIREAAVAARSRL